jgi:conserved oligomeric Golgi complex subunit 3
MRATRNISTHPYQLQTWSILILFAFRVYRDQLILTESHLDSLLASANATLELLAGLSSSFKAVDAQTTAFQSQCENLLNDQRRTLKLADDMADNLQYYTYLEPITKRLNAPGAGRWVQTNEFSDMLSNLDACLEYMQAHVRIFISCIFL